MEFQYDCSSNTDSLKFLNLLEKLLLLTQTKICDRNLLDGYLKNINELDFKQFIIKDKNNAIMLLVNQMCSIIQPNEASLVVGCSKFLLNLMKQGVTLQDRTFSTCKRWILENLEFSDSTAMLDTLSVLEMIFITNPCNVMQDLGKLLAEDSILLKHIHPLNKKWNEEQLVTLNCLLTILNNKEQNEQLLPIEYLSAIKKNALEILYSISQENLNKLYFNKTVTLCIKILRKIITQKLKIDETDNLGELLGLIQAYLFYGIKGYENIIPQLLHPSTMNLPEIVCPVQSKKYFRNHKTKNKRQSSKKIVSENKNNRSLEVLGLVKYSSDSETSDSESRNSAFLESSVRLEAIYLLNALVECTSNRKFFGYWTQIVSSGSKLDTRVLTKSILREPLSKIRQISLSTLNDLLLGAKIFLTHAEDIERMSFVTFFGMLSSVIKEIHFTLSLLLSTERNVVVLTQALKCTATLAQGTPYSRLKPGLATKLVRHCRNHLLHKDPTVRVAALSVFESFALSEPVTPEIFNILAKSSNIESDFELFNSSFCNKNELETEEIVRDDFDENMEQIVEFSAGDNNDKTRVSTLVQVCFENVSDETANEPVRLQSLKLLGTLAFNTSGLIFSHLEIITKSLIDITNEQEPQVALHACRVLEIIAGRLADSKSADVPKFWNIAFNPIISLIQHNHTNVREVACDCLGNIGADMLAQLSREKSIMIITGLFGAVKDHESAVKAASLRALGLLVTLPILEEDTGFLMDLIDETCTALEDHNLGVRIKAAWAMASLCDCLVKRENSQVVEPISMDIALPKLYKTSIKAGQDHEKVKCNAVRAIGSIMFLCTSKSFLPDTSCGLEVLINCATVGNDMKVRWNACRAIGIILSRDPDKLLPLPWKDEVFPVLCNLICNSSNFKVRTNAAWALSVCRSFDKYIVTSWKSVMMALENSQHVPSLVEYAHRDVLVQQLCLTLCHLALYTDISELESLWIEIKDHFDDISHHIKQFQEHILPEKAGDLIKAKGRFVLFTQQAKKSSEKLLATKLVELFKREDRYDHMDALSILN